MTSKVFLALRVPADPMRAFEVFTQEIASWWQPSGLFKVSEAGDSRLGFEPGEGGRLFTTFEDCRLQLSIRGNQDCAAANKVRT
jgi:hypothetical protein